MKENENVWKAVEISGKLNLKLIGKFLNTQRKTQENSVKKRSQLRKTTRNFTEFSNVYQNFPKSFLEFSTIFQGFSMFSKIIPLALVSCIFTQYFQFFSLLTQLFEISRVSRILNQIFHNLPEFSRSIAHVNKNNIRFDNPIYFDSHQMGFQMV